MKKSKLDARQALNTSNAERPLKLKIQELVDADTARLEAQPDRMHLLACKEHLGLGDWIEITGIGIGGESHYTISEESIRFIGWNDETIRSSPAHQQPKMIRQNEEPGLAFPCTPRALLDFVDNGAGRLTGSFLIPVEFRNAVDQIELAPAVVSVGQSTLKKKIEDEKKEYEKIHRDLDGAPSLTSGRNDRKKVEAWVAWQASKKVKNGDNIADLADRIRLEADRWGYESERKNKDGNYKFTTANIIKMIPAKTTGGRAKNTGKPKK